MEDTFRIPASNTPATWRALYRPRRSTGRDDLSPDDDPDSILVIPPLGDCEVENDVRRLLGHHGVHSRTSVLDPETDPREPLDSGGEGSWDRDRDRDGVEMDVDELESDCVSSQAPSPSGSPTPASQLSSSSVGAHSLELLCTRPTLLARHESSGPYSLRWGVSLSACRQWRRASIIRVVSLRVIGLRPPAVIILHVAVNTICLRILMIMSFL